ncbi:MAG: fumarylacetoacetate hydrolase family protein [Ignavibacteriae bacterium]|nr:fumarylacetoacetate hydrolase family protein [Ignavibacteriota bacterium]MCB9214837.1 fumarylacetoacetate hydrolase family protein [Ignavibacteria bacterium]
MNEQRLRELAFFVDTAAVRGETIEQLTAKFPDLTVDNAYTVQKMSIDQRIERGERLVGMKMGLTSKAKMEQVGVHEPIYGRLTDGMIINNGGDFSIEKGCHPRVEPEVAFIMKRDIEGKVTDAEAVAAVEGVCAALEVIDSRYRDFKFTLPDVVADNTSASGFVLGSTVRPISEVNLGNLGIVMEVNGKAEQIGNSSAIYEHPLRSLVQLLHMLARRGEGLKAGQVVLAGGATAAVPLKQGDHVRVLVDELESAEFRVS